MLRSTGPKPKAEVARLLGLSPQTASVIMRNLEERGFIERCAPVRGKVGQPSIPMRLARNGALFFSSTSIMQSGVHAMGFLSTHIPPALLD